MSLNRISFFKFGKDRLSCLVFPYVIQLFQIRIFKIRIVFLERSGDHEISHFRVFRQQRTMKIGSRIRPS